MKALRLPGSLLALALCLRSTAATVGAGQHPNLAVGHTYKASVFSLQEKQDKSTGAGTDELRILQLRRDPASGLWWAEADYGAYFRFVPQGDALKAMKIWHDGMLRWRFALQGYLITGSVTYFGYGADTHLFYRVREPEGHSLPHAGGTHLFIEERGFRYKKDGGLPQDRRGVAWYEDQFFGAQVRYWFLDQAFGEIREQFGAPVFPDYVPLKDTYCDFLPVQEHEVLFFKLTKGTMTAWQRKETKDANRKHLRFPSFGRLSQPGRAVDSGRRVGQCRGQRKDRQKLFGEADVQLGWPQ